MNYSHTKEESAEILRCAIGLMGSHPASFQPPNYAVWYEYVAGLNPALSRELDEFIARRIDVTDKLLARLHGAYIAARDMEAWEQAQRDLRAALDETGRAATGAEMGLMQSAATLQSSLVELRGPIGGAALEKVVENLISEVLRMQTVAKTLASRLAMGSSEVDHVIERLERVQTEPLRDPLTGLNNRSGLQRAAQSMQGAGEDMVGRMMVALDVDGFKEINDTYGHVIGDKVLMKVADILRDCVVDSDHVVARIGGDEFVILLSVLSMQHAATLAEKVRVQVRKITIDAKGVHHLERVSLSVGVAAGRKGDTLDTLRHRADMAMYLAKDQGRNRVRYAIDDHQG